MRLLFQPSLYLVWNSGQNYEAKQMFLLFHEHSFRFGKASLKDARNCF